MSDVAVPGAASSPRSAGQGAATVSGRAVRRTPRSASAPDRAMRCVLGIRNCPAVDESETHRIFGTSIFLSALRCLLSYIVFPIVLPVAGLASSVGPYVGIPVGVAALVFDILGVRRFWLADHRQRWAFTFLYLAVASMVTVLLVIDIVHLAHG
ncbi:MAG: hypothetical protein M0029_09360 [Actinomycetota bacterium]|nr:hypothetical protein [Actinomycetota bacterium]